MVARLPLPNDVYKRDDKRWCRVCPSCGIEVDHLRRNYCVNASLTKQPCIRCSNVSNHPSGMVGSVRVSWFNSFMKSALLRGYAWHLTPQFVDAMHQEQDGACVYSGLPIGWSSVGWGHTASIDRIDNAAHYTEDNVQLVHKKVNMMRGTLGDEEFKELCCLIAENQSKW